jgi:hypothetical protein
MSRVVSGGKWKWFVGLLLLVLLSSAGVAWLERRELLARYCVYCLTRATDDATRTVWVNRVAGLGMDALPLLIDCLTRDDPQACGNARAALACLAERWEARDPNRTVLADRLAKVFPQLSLPGQQGALELVMALARPDEPSTTQAAVRVLGEAGRVLDKEIRKQALALTDVVARQASPPETLEPCRELIRVCLRDDEAENRLHAIHLASQPSLNMLEQVMGLVRDPRPEVRRAALLAVGPVPEMMATDDLLHWLHDPDASVRRVCEGALQGRGLRDDQIKLGRLMTAADAQIRLQVLECLSQTSGLEPAIWLRRLSHDPVPAVRAAAVRAAVEFPQVDLADRLEQIFHNDPSPTVRQLAQYYLACRKTAP